MNSAGDTADQMMKMTLEGIEVAAKVVLAAGGSASKSLAATLYAIITDNKKVKGKTRLDAMLKSGKELKVFAIRHQDLKKFCEEAKRYGVLYSVLKEKNNTDGICDIMVRAEDASKISRIVDKFELATIDTKAVRESIMASRKPFEGVPTLTEKEHDELVEKLREELKNPAFAPTVTSDNPLEPTSNKSVATRRSVRKELASIKRNKIRHTTLPENRTNRPKVPKKKKVKVK